MFGPNNKNFQVPDIAIVRQQKKRLPYSIIPIGGKAELVQWKKDEELRMEARDSFLKPIREATRLRAIGMVQNQNAIAIHNESDRAVIAYNEDRKVKPSTNISPAEITPPKLRMIDKLTKLALDLINSAFPE